MVTVVVCVSGGGDQHQGAGLEEEEEEEGEMHEEGMMFWTNTKSSTLCICVPLRGYEHILKNKKIKYMIILKK